MRFLVFFIVSILPFSPIYGRHIFSPNDLRVWIRNIPAYHSTRDSLLASAFMDTDSTGCVVSGFTISLQAPGHDFYGPLYSNSNTFTEDQKAAIKKWDYPGSTLFIQDIHLNCNGQDTRAVSLEYYFDR